MKRVLGRIALTCVLLAGGACGEPDRDGFPVMAGRYRGLSDTTDFGLVGDRLFAVRVTGEVVRVAALERGAVTERASLLVGGTPLAAAVGSGMNSLWIALTVCHGLIERTDDVTCQGSQEVRLLRFDGNRTIASVADRRSAEAIGMVGPLRVTAGPWDYRDSAIVEVTAVDRASSVKLLADGGGLRRLDVDAAPVGRFCATATEMVQLSADRNEAAMRNENFRLKVLTADRWEAVPLAISGSPPYDIDITCSTTSAFVIEQFAQRSRISVLLQEQGAWTTRSLTTLDGPASPIDAVRSGAAALLVLRSGANDRLHSDVVSVTKNGTRTVPTLSRAGESAQVEFVLLDPQGASRVTAVRTGDALEVSGLS